MIETVPKIIDKALALEQAGGSSDLANELFAMLLKDLPQFDREIRAAYERRDWKMLQCSVHKLNGAAIYCGVPALRAAAETLEKELKWGNVEAVGHGVDKVLEEIRQVQQHVHLRLA